MSEKRPRLPKGKKHPLPVSDGEALVKWLNAKRADLEHALARVRLMRKIAPDQDWIRRNIDYYEHAVGAVKWLIHHAKLSAGLPVKAEANGHADSGDGGE